MENRTRPGAAAIVQPSSPDHPLMMFQVFIPILCMSPLQYSSRTNLLPGRNPSQPHSGCDIRNSSCNQGQGKCREHEGILTSLFHVMHHRTLFANKRAHPHHTSQHALPPSFPAFPPTCHRLFAGYRRLCPQKTPVKSAQPPSQKNRPGESAACCPSC